MPRDPQKRKASREMDKLRKRTKRAIARLEKFSEETTDMRQRHAAKQQLTQLQAQLAQSYAGRRTRTYSEQAKAAGRAMAGVKTRTIKEMRKGGTYDFREEMNKASRGKVSMLGQRGQLKVQMFYRATQSAWEGLPNQERTKAILDALGVNSLEEAYVKVMNTPEMRKILNGITSNIEDTNDISAAYENAERTPRKIDSPTEVMQVQLIEFTKAYATA